jgi:hypothetical protein
LDQPKWNADPKWRARGLANYAELGGKFVARFEHIQASMSNPFQKKPRAPRPVKGTPTRTNIFCLVDLFKGADSVANRVDNLSAPHIRRCLAAGLCEVTDGGKSLTLTDAGRAAVAGFAR